jgi:hypothetical protein
MNNPMSGTDPSGYLKVCDTFIVCSVDQVQDDNFNKPISLGRASTSNGESSDSQQSSTSNPETTDIGSQAKIAEGGTNLSGGGNPEPDPATIKDTVSPNQAWLNDGIVSSDEKTTKILLNAFNDGIDSDAFTSAVDQIDRFWDGSGNSKNLTVDIRIVKDKSKANLIFSSCADFGFCNTLSVRLLVVFKF